MTIVGAIVLFFVCLIPAHAQRQIVVRIAIADSVAITESHLHRMKSRIHKLLPDHEILTAKTHAVTHFLDADRIRGELKRQIAAFEFQPGDTVTHLDIYTHGGTDFERSESSLKYLGEYGSDGPSEKLAEILDPLRPYISSSLAITQNSCSLFCRREGAQQRAEAFLRYLGAPDGQIYGAITSENEAPIFPYVGFTITATLTAAFFAIQMSRDGAAFPQDVIPWISSHQDVAIFFGAFINLWAFLKTAVAGYNLIDGSSNIGRLIRFKEGQIESSFVIEKHKNRRALYSRESCARLLELNYKYYDR